MFCYILLYHVISLHLIIISNQNFPFYNNILSILIDNCYTVDLIRVYYRMHRNKDGSRLVAQFQCIRFVCVNRNK